MSKKEQPITALSSGAEVVDLNAFREAKSVRGKVNRLTFRERLQSMTREELLESARRTAEGDRTPRMVAWFNSIDDDREEVFRAMEQDAVYLNEAAEQLGLSEQD